MHIVAYPGRGVCIIYTITVFSGYLWHFSLHVVTLSPPSPSALHPIHHTPTSAFCKVSSACPDHGSPPQLLLPDGYQGTSTLFLRISWTSFTSQLELLLEFLQHFHWLKGFPSMSCSILSDFYTIHFTLKLWLFIILYLLLYHKCLEVGDKVFLSVLLSVFWILAYPQPPINHCDFSEWMSREDPSTSHVW